MKKGRPFNPNLAVGNKAAKLLKQAINKMTADYWHTLEPLFNNGIPSADTSASALDMVAAHSQQDFDEVATPLASMIVEGASETAKAQSAIFMRRMQKELTIRPTSIQETGRYHDVFQALTQENANLFRTIPPNFHKDVQIAVSNSIISGRGLQDLVPFFDIHSNKTKNYAKLRALDQTRKAFNTLARERMKAAGIEKFEWLHTGGGKEPRKLHQELNGKIFSFDNPPFIGVMYGENIHGFPSDLPNCRCRFRSVILDK